MATILSLPPSALRSYAKLCPLRHLSPKHLDDYLQGIYADVHYLHGYWEATNTVEHVINHANFALAHCQNFMEVYGAIKAPIAEVFETVEYGFLRDNLRQKIVMYMLELAARREKELREVELAERFRPFGNPKK